MTVFRPRGRRSQDTTGAMEIQNRMGVWEYGEYEMAEEAAIEMNTGQLLRGDTRRLKRYPALLCLAVLVRTRYTCTSLSAA